MPGGGFDYVGDVGAANAGGDFEEINLAVGVGPEEFGVGDAANRAEAFDDVAVDVE